MACQKLVSPWNENKDKLLRKIASTYWFTNLQYNYRVLVNWPKKFEINLKIKLLFHFLFWRNCTRLFLNVFNKFILRLNINYYLSKFPIKNCCKAFLTLFVGIKVVSSHLGFHHAIIFLFKILRCFYELHFWSQTYVNWN